MEYTILIKILQDTFVDNTRKKISRDEITLYCANLAKAVQKNYKPDIVIAIDTGGFMPGKLIAKKLGIPVRHIVIRRNINIGRMYNLDPIPMRWIMSVYHHFLFHTTKPTLNTKIDIDISDKNILIVDDVLHTGETINVAINYLEMIPVKKIKVATLSYVSKRKPDFSILPIGNYSFPWSKDFIDS